MDRMLIVEKLWENLWDSCGESCGKGGGFPRLSKKFVRGWWKRGDFHGIVQKIYNFFTHIFFSFLRVVAIVLHISTGLTIITTNIFIYKGNL